MSVSKFLGLATLFLFAVVLYFNWPDAKDKNPQVQQEKEIEEVTLTVENIEEIPAVVVEQPQHASDSVSLTPSTLIPTSNDNDLPKEVDRILQLFQPFDPLLPIVETVSYTSRVPWLQGRPVYLGDYAAHYQTSKHFISRSLHGTGNYLSDVVSKGDRFNVFREDKEIEFHLVVDLSRLKLWVYCYDTQEGERILLKSYPVCVGKLDPSSSSGSITPTGVFALGSEIATYKEGVMGTYRNNLCEMITVFGKRWIPLNREIANCTGSCKGLGFHGMPWRRLPETGELVEERESIGKYESSGCIRLLTEDMEELFAVIISKPSYVHIVKDFSEAKLPGKEQI